MKAGGRPIGEAGMLDGSESVPKESHEVVCEVRNVFVTQGEAELCGRGEGQKIKNVSNVNAILRGRKRQPLLKTGILATHQYTYLRRATR